MYYSTIVIYSQDRLLLAAVAQFSSAVRSLLLLPGSGQDRAVLLPRRGRERYTSNAHAELKFWLTSEFHLVSHAIT